ncbi:hypothetical protein JST97_09195 [bacterium]|nr:hypothetical protein [bacterium]
MTISEVLDQPGPGQVEVWLCHRWHTLGIGDIPVSTLHRGFLSLLLFTDLQAWELYLHTEPHSYDRLTATGDELISRLHDRADFDAIFIDPHTQPERAPFPPSMVEDLANARDPRQVVNVLPARSVAEIHHFFEDQGYPTPAHQIIEEGGQLVAQYGSFRFSLVQAQARPADYGQGPSLILCAGKLLERLRNELQSSSSARAHPLARLRALQILDEFEKLLLPGTSNVDRAALRSCEGARFVREHFWLTHDLATTRAHLEAPAGPPEDWREPTGDLEEAVSRPAPGQLSLLLESQWWVWRGQVGLAPIPGETVFAFTGPERLTAFLEQLEQARHMSVDPELRHLGDGWMAVPVVHWDDRYRNAYTTRMRGRDLLHAASQPGACELIRMNPGGGLDSSSITASDALEMLAGRDPRPGAFFVKARSRAEIEAYLSQNFLNHPQHRQVRLQGCLLDEYSDSRKRFYFYPVELECAQAELAPGRTSILCAGWWTKVLFTVNSIWEPGLPEQWRLQKLCWTAEMLKLVDPTTDRIPQSEVRSANGLSAVHNNPALLEGAWLRELRQKLGGGVPQRTEVESNEKEQ